MLLLFFVVTRLEVFQPKLNESRERYFNFSGKNFCYLSRANESLWLLFYSFDVCVYVHKVTTQCGRFSSLCFRMHFTHFVQNDE